MDLSKLPRLSDTPRPPENSVPASTFPGAPDDPPAQHGFGPESFINIAIGLILLLMQPNLVRWIVSLFGGPAPPGVIDKDRGEITYAQSLFFLADMGMGLFALALIVDGIVLNWRRRAALGIAMALMGIATAWNLATVIRLYMVPGFGLQIMPALAAAFGIYSLMLLWQRLKPRAVGG